MKAIGTGMVLHFGGESLVLRIDKHEKDKFRDLIHREMVLEEESRKTLDAAINFEATISSSEEGGKVHLTIPHNPTISLKDIIEVKSRAQENTFWGILRFIFWADEGRKPKDDETYWLYEGMLQLYGVEDTNPVTGRIEPIRLSDPRMNKFMLSKLIEGALNELAQKEIPKSVLDTIGEPMKKLWTRWYRWRYDQGDADPLFALDMEEQSWLDYRKRHPVCELCSLGPTSYDPLERIHIISGGADGAIYEEPWNWIHGHHSHHVAQHGDRQQQSVGWDLIEKQFPHIAGKLDRARKLSGEKTSTELEIF
jgi:hypothetical protein